MKAQGLYDPRVEHDACGVAFVARLDAERVARGRLARARRARAARAPRRRRCGRGDGRRCGDPPPAPARVLRAAARRAAGSPAATASPSASCRGTPRRRAELEQLLADTVAAEGQRGRRLARRPRRRAPGGHDRAAARAPHPAAVRRRVRRARRRPGRVRAQALRDPAHAEHAAGADLVVPSFSSRTIVYKGMLTAPQLRRYFPDLHDARFASALALVHSRFSTNTFPSWELAHPYRLVAHNGEINTLRGNVELDAARASRSSPPSSSATTSRRCCRSCGPAARTRRSSTTCSSCSCSPAARCRTR